jgi:hypothetical protein
MARLLSFLMIFVLVTSQGTAMAAAVCRHQDAQAHAVARASADAAVAGVSLREDAAEATASKKGSPTTDAAAAWPAPLLPADAELPPLRTAERLLPRPGRQAPLASLAAPPLLEPPSA